MNSQLKNKERKTGPILGSPSKPEKNDLLTNPSNRNAVGSYVTVWLLLSWAMLFAFEMVSKNKSKKKIR